MGRLVKSGALLLALLGVGAVLAAPASAAPHRVPAEITIYFAFQPSPGLFGIPAQIFSPNERCLDNRTVKYTLFKGRRAKTWDVARSSREGAFAFLIPVEAVVGVDKATIKLVPLTVKRPNGAKMICAGKRLVATERVAPGLAGEALDGGLADSARAASVSHVELLGVGGEGADGVAYGRVLSDNSKCVSGRKIAVYAVSESGRSQLDLARSGKSGAWAGHLTPADGSDGAELMVVLKRKKYKQNGKKKVCGGARDRLEPSLPPRANADSR